MANLPDTWSGLALTQNRTLLVYPFTVADEGILPRLEQPFAELGKMEAGDFFAHMPGDNRQEQDGSAPIWQPIVAEQARKHLSPDLHQVVDRILHGESPAPAEQGAAGQLPYRLRRDFLKDEFAIDLRATACQRLKGDGVIWDGSGLIRFGFHDVKVYLLATGIGLLTLELEINAPLNHNGGSVCSDLLLEAIYALSHPESRGERILHGKLQQKIAFEAVAAGDCVGVVEESASEPGAGAVRGRYGVRKGALGADGSTVRVGAGPNEPCLVFHPGKMGSFSLGELAQALLGGVAAGNSGHARFFSFAFARCPEGTPTAAAGELAFRLSGNYNKDYAVCSAQVQREAHSLFQNIQFAATMQGGAVVVSADPENSPMHLREYFKNSVRCSYIPLALLAYHEYLQLTRLLHRCALRPDRNSLEAEANHIRSNRDQLLNFRLYYRFSRVSNMSHHNTVHATWRAALALDTMLDELSTDVAEADNVFLAAKQSQEDERWHQQQEHWEQEKAQWREQEEQEKKKHAAREKQWRGVGTVVALLASFHFIYEIFEIFLRLQYPPEKWLLLLHKGDGATWQALEHAPEYASAVSFFENLHHTEMVYLGISGVVAVVAAIAAYLQGPKLGHH